MSYDLRWKNIRQRALLAFLTALLRVKCSGFDLDAELTSRNRLAQPHRGHIMAILRCYKCPTLL